MTSVLKTFYNKNMIEVGIDEAGRGPMFGRVYAGAVIMPKDPDYDHKLIKDSKKLSARKRLMAYDYIKEYAVDYSVYYHNENMIDKINILKATMDAMHKAVDNLKTRPDHIMVDGTYFKPYAYEGIHLPYTTIEKGDNLYTNIAAASIMAKVSRDNYIIELCKQYPDLDTYYNLSKNKGYGAKVHMDGIRKYGITKWHRKSFGICKTSNVIEIQKKVQEGEIDVEKEEIKQEK